MIKKSKQNYLNTKAKGPLRAWKRAEVVSMKNMETGRKRDTKGRAETH